MQTVRKKNKVNYQKKLEQILAEIAGQKPAPKLLLHSCCAPCSSYVLEYLSGYFRITDFYYNPNISPESEYRKRVEEMKRLIDEMPLANPVEFLEGCYEPERFLRLSEGLEREPEGGARCLKCFTLRLTEAALAARETGADYFATTLTISPLKNEQALNEIGLAIQETVGVKYLPSDFKKKNGYKRSIELSAEYQLYRQNYCGCGFSRREAEERENRKK